MDYAGSFARLYDEEFKELFGVLRDRSMWRQRRSLHTLLFGFTLLLCLSAHDSVRAQSALKSPGTASRKSGQDTTVCRVIISANNPASHAAAAAELSHSHQAANAGDLAEAERSGERSLELEASADAWYQVGLVRFARGDARCSLAAFTSGASLRSPGSEELRIVALDYVLLNDPADAERWLRAAVSMGPANAEAWYDLGRVLYSVRRYSEAEEAFRKTIALRPRDVRSETYLGLIAETAVDAAGAESAYRRAIRYQQDTPKPFALPYRSLGVLLRDSGHLEEADTLLRRSIEIEPADAVNHAELGQCLAKQRRWAEARTELETALRLHPSRPAWHFQLGRIDRELRLEDEAKAQFTLARTEIDANPEQEPEP